MSERASPGQPSTRRIPLDPSARLHSYRLRRSEKPNIVFIMDDNMRYGDPGCYGAVKIPTPNMNRLAREGIRFTDCHSASAVCTPSRYCWRSRPRREQK